MVDFGRYQRSGTKLPEDRRRVVYRTRYQFGLMFAMSRETAIQEPSQHPSSYSTQDREEWSEVEDVEHGRALLRHVFTGTSDRGLTTGWRQSRDADEGG